MALRRKHSMNAAFSMASMTDVIFLLLIFFMVTSTFVFPSALEVNLPESSEQTPVKPSMKIYVDDEGAIYTSNGDSPLTPIDDMESLAVWLRLGAESGEAENVGLYADESVPYGTIVKILDTGVTNSVKIVLATTPVDAQTVRKYVK